MSKHTLTYTPIKLPDKPKPSRKQLGKLFAVSFLAVLGIFGVLAFGYTIFYTFNQNQTLAKKLESLESKGSVAGAETTQAATDEVLRQIAESTRARVESMVLIPPSDETPRFAQIDDMSKVSKEPFFRDVKLGDHLLIYQKIGIAVLFRPSVGKIITMTYVNPEGTTGTQTSAPATQPQQIAQPPVEAAPPVDMTNATEGGLPIPPPGEADVVGKPVVDAEATPTPSPTVSESPTPTVAPAP